jgi:hypothetical protein
MGFPALRRYPQLAPDSTADVHDQSGTVNGHSVPGEAFDLSTVVEAVFDPTVDRVIYELPANLDDNQGHHDGRFITGGAGLAAGVACADAFERLGKSQFVVVVIDGACWERELAEELSCLAAIRSRLVVLAPSEPDVVSALAELDSAGWQMADLRGRSTARGIAKSLVAARYDQQSTLILLDAAVSDAGLRAAIDRHCVDSCQRRLAKRVRRDGDARESSAGASGGRSTSCASGAGGRSRVVAAGARCYASRGGDC